MQAKSRFLIVTAGVLEILYGLAFVCMGVACSYISSGTSTSYAQPPSGGSESGTIPVWQINGMASSYPYSSPVRREAVTANRKDVTGHGIWLAILYTITGFCGVIAGQESDRTTPLLHTILCLICIAWSPLMYGFEMLYLLVRPASIYSYSFLNEMDLISSQRHWTAYIVSICVVVAGSALYLFSAALSAYQYGIRMIKRPVSSAVVTAVNCGGTLRTATPQPTTTQKIQPTTEDRSKSSSPNTGNRLPSKPLHQLTLPLKDPNTVASPQTGRTSTDDEIKFMKHSRTEPPVHGHGYLPSSMTLPNTQAHLKRQNYASNLSATIERTGTSSSQSNVDFAPGLSPNSYSHMRTAYERDLDRPGNRNMESMGSPNAHSRFMREPQRSHNERIDFTDGRGGAVYGFGEYYDNSQEAVV